MIKQMIKEINKINTEELMENILKNVVGQGIEIPPRTGIDDAIEKRFPLFKYAGDGLVETSEIKLGEL